MNIEDITSEQAGSSRVVSKALKSAKWSYLAYAVTRGLQALAPLVLALFLTPADFGVVGVATLIIALATALQSTGLSRALIQTDRDLRKSANALFVVGVGLSLLLYTVVFFAAPWLARQFDDLRAIAVIRVMGLQLIIGAFDTIQVAILEREFKYRQLFWRRLLPALTPIVVGVPLAYWGYGYWALVAGALLGSLLGVWIVWRRSWWRPSFQFDVITAKPLIKFGAYVAVESFSAWAFNYGDNALVGRFFGTTTLGLYSLGFNVVMLSMSVVIGPITSVAYSAFSRLKDNLVDLRTYYFRSVQLVALVAMPISAVLFMLAAPLSDALLGETWHGIAPIIQILAIMPGLSYLWVLNPEIFKAVGRPEITPKIHLATMAFMIVAYSLAIPQGFMSFVYARASIGFVSAPVHIHLASQVLGLPRTYLWQCIRSPLLAALVMGAAIQVMFTLWSLNTLSEIVVAAVAGALVYLAMLVIIDRPLLTLALRVAKRAL